METENPLQEEFMDWRTIAIVCALIFSLTGTAALVFASDVRGDFKLLNPNDTPYIVGTGRCEAIETTRR